MACVQSKRGVARCPKQKRSDSSAWVTGDCEEWGGDQKHSPRGGQQPEGTVPGVRGGQLGQNKGGKIFVRAAKASTKCKNHIIYKSFAQSL